MSDAPPLRGMIAAMNADRIIGADGKIPWRYKADMVRFKRITLDGTVIMGRLTWESMGSKPLVNRRNVVVSSRPIEGGAEVFPDLASALASADGPVWFIGGARIYEEAMKHANLIDLTYVPDVIDHPNPVRFPAIDEAVWEAGPVLVHEDDPRLTRQEFRRRLPREA